MAVSQDSEAAVAIKQRLQANSMVELTPLWSKALVDCFDPVLALANLERWLDATANPGTYLAALAASPGLAKVLMNLLGASQPVADTLIQNPELAAILVEPDALHEHPSREDIVAEGRGLLAGATSYSHSLDRLRFLKQRRQFPIVINDIAGAWPQPVVWRAISDLALAIIELTAEAVWSNYASEKDLSGPLPVAIVAFGKLGGLELNYSSDVDLVFVTEDFCELTETQVSRLCEAIVRALSDPMGRGSLYRVDLRLRPFGSAGAIAPRMKSIEAYYNLHAQPWEIQALIRSRPVVGSEDVINRWLALVQSHCFRPKLSELALEEIFTMRDRTEQSAPPDDIKRGRGGIRDVEFLTQLLQLINGHEHPGVRTPNTVEALTALNAAGVLSRRVAEGLAADYEFLRKTEHRLQFVADQQTHQLPPKEPQRTQLAHLAGFDSWKSFFSTLSATRDRVRAEYTRIVHPPEALGRDDLLEHLGPLAEGVRRWFDALPESQAFYGSLLENRGSLDRVCRLALFSPALLEELPRSVSLTEDILSGEIEEDPSFDPVVNLAIDAPLEHVGRTYHRERTRMLSRWTLAPHFNLGKSLTQLRDELMIHLLRRQLTQLDLIALGSYAVGDESVYSDADVLLLTGSQSSHREAELQAQNLLGMIDVLRRFEPSLGLDLRLRPEGSRGLLVRTYEGLKVYELEAMEMWERFALGQCRQVHGNPKALEVVVQCAYALPLTPERLKELVTMKRRIESERVAPQHWKRHVKLGYGGLADVEWFVHLTEMRYPTAARVTGNQSFEVRVRNLARAQLINALEQEELLSARKHLLETRNRIALLGFERDVVPENPDKLDRLASAAGFDDGNAFLSYHLRVIETVRAVYSEGLERLKA